MHKPRKMTMGTAGAVAFCRPDGNPTAWELLKLGTLGVVLAPLRALLFAAALLSCGAGIGLAHRLGARGRCVNFSVRAGARLLLFILGFHVIHVIGKVVGKEVRVRRRRRRGDGAGVRIVVANHLSLVEVLHLIVAATGAEDWAAPLPQLVSKASVFRIPLLGYFAQEVLQCIAVHRTPNGGGPAPTQSPSASAQILAWADRHRQYHTREGSCPHTPTLVIFPEGTTSNGTGVLRFHSGAFLPGVPVHPILYRFHSDGADAPSFIPTFESIFFPFWLWRLLYQPWNTMRVEHCPPVIPTRSELEAGAPYPQFAQRTRSIIASALGVPMYNLTYADKNVYHDCLRAAFSGKEYDKAGVLAGSKPEDPVADRIRLGCVRVCTGLGIVRSLVAMLLTPQPFRRTPRVDGKEEKKTF